MIIFGKKRTLLLHQLISQETGGSMAVANFDALGNSISSQYETNAAGKEIYPSVEEKAAILAHSLITTRPFADGNTRTGMYVMLTLLEANGIHSSADSAEILRLGKAIESGKMTYKQLLDWIYDHEKFD